MTSGVETGTITTDTGDGPSSFTASRPCSILGPLTQWVPIMGIQPSAGS